MAKRPDSPAFLGIGMQKAGTSWLHHQLSGHPDLWLPAHKELHFFDGLLNPEWDKRRRNAGTAAIQKLAAGLQEQSPEEREGSLAQMEMWMHLCRDARDGKWYRQFWRKFTPEGKLIKSFGGRGKDDKEKFRTPHSLGIDTRYGEPRLLVCDREKRRLVHFDLEGKFIGEYATGLRRPCAVSFWGDYCAVAELESRAVVIDEAGKVISLLGENPNKKHWANFRVAPADQKLGVFSAPHGLCFDKDGNLYVQDWNKTGRATQLKLVK